MLHLGLTLEPCIKMISSIMISFHSDSLRRTGSYKNKHIYMNEARPMPSPQPPHEIKGIIFKCAKNWDISQTSNKTSNFINHQTFSLFPSAHKWVSSQYALGSLTGFPLAFGIVSFPNHLLVGYEHSIADLWGYSSSGITRSLLM